MLRKKLSKVILSSLVAAMAVGVSSVGQVKAQEVQLISETTGQAPVGTAITDQNIIAEIQNLANQSITITSPIELNQDVADALQARVASGEFKITIQNGGSLEVKSGVSLNGANKLTIARAAGCTGSVINVKLENKTREISKVVLDGIIFGDDNKDSKVPVISSGTLSAGKTINVSNCKLLSGFLFQDRNSNIMVNEQTINLGTGAGIYVNNTVTQTITLDPITTNGTTLNITGTVAGGTIPQNSKVSIEIQEVVTAPATAPAPKVIEATLDAQGKFSTQFVGDINKTYKVTAKFGTGTSAIQSTTQTVTLNSGIKADVTNITTNSADITITRGQDFINKPLTLIVKSNGQTNQTIEIQADVSKVTLTGLNSNTTYTYAINDKSATPVTLVSGTFTTKIASNITGGDGNIVTDDITSSDINKSDIKDVTVSIPVSNKYLVTSMEGGKDFSVNIKGVTATIKDGKLVLDGLVPEKEYKNLVLTYVDKNNRTKTVRIAKFTTKAAETKTRQFIKDVYKYSLDRNADEEGFSYWEKQLVNKTTSPQDLVKNLLSEKEFINKYKTTEGKIEALYQVIVNRKSDAQGLKFWVDKYNTFIKQGFSEKIALSLIVDKMVNEQEFKNRVKGLGL